MFTVTWFQVLKPYRYSSLKMHINTHVTLRSSGVLRNEEWKFRMEWNTDVSGHHIGPILVDQAVKLVALGIKLLGVLTNYFLRTLKQ